MSATGHGAPGRRATGAREGAPLNLFMRIRTLARFGALLAMVALPGPGLATTAGDRFVRLEGQPAERVAAVEGATQQPATGFVVRAPHGAGTLLDWASEALAGQVVEKSGSIVLADQNFKERSHRPFVGATIEGVGFGAYDAKGKEAVYLTLMVSGALLPPVAAPGPIVYAPEGAERWQSDAFRVDIGGLPCSRVSRIEPFSVKLTAAGPQPSHLIVYLPPEDAAPFQAWQGAPGVTFDGTIESLGSAGQALTTLRLGAISMVGLTADAGSSPPRVRVELAPKTARLEAK